MQDCCRAYDLWLRASTSCLEPQTSGVEGGTSGVENGISGEECRAGVELTTSGLERQPPGFECTASDVWRLLVKCATSWYRTPCPWCGRSAPCVRRGSSGGDCNVSSAKRKSSGI